MGLKFTLIDYSVDDTGTSTVIDEPVGWDGISMRLQRHKTWKGFFDFFDDSGIMLQFDGGGLDILKAAYELNGVEAYVELLIEYACSDTDPFEQVYLGKFVFPKYKHTCSDRCYVEIGVESADCLMKFANRYNQKVDLDSLSSFDNPPVEQTIAVTAEFIAGQTISLTGEFKWLHTGIRITISGSANNNHTFTVTNASRLLTGITEVTVGSVIINEASVSCFITAIFPIDNLPGYPALDTTLILPAKKVYLESISVANQVTTFHALQNSGGSTGWLPSGGGFFGGFRQVCQTIDTFVIQSDLSTFKDTALAFGEFVSGSEEDTPNPTEVLDLDLLPICPSFDIRIRISFTGIFTSPGNAVRNEVLRLRITKGDHPFDFDGAVTVGSVFLAGFIGSSPYSQPISCNFDTTVTLNAGEKLFYFFYYSEAKSDALQSDTTITINNDFKINLSTDSLCADTTVSAYLVNETMSRITEAVTNDCLRVYSDYFGRTDAHPYKSDIDGCGGLRAITNGLKIRHAQPQDGYSAIKIAVSMQDIFEALNATDNIGMCLEDDPHRSGEKLIRVEPVHYFYKDAVLMTCPNTADVTREILPSELISVFKTGYQKWKTWSINGLNDIYGNREYRTELTEFKYELDRTCKFLASDYAIEWMRRQYGLTSSDSRYDDDIFFLCLKTGYFGFLPSEYTEFVADHTLILHGFNLSGTYHPGDNIHVFGGPQAGDYDVASVSISGSDTVLTLSQIVVNEIGSSLVINNSNTLKFVEQGLSDPNNINFPNTLLNFKIAPSRNAMRWFKTILQNYRQYLTGKMIFTAGEGNIVAQGTVQDPADCRLESTVIQEKMDIDLDLFSVPEDHYPMMYPELVKFQYPVTWQQYKDIRANPYGLIGYQCGAGEMEYGWIEDFQLKPYSGMGEFTLRPKIS